MKIKQFIVGYLFAVLFFVPGAQAEKIEFEVHGMACSFCAYGLEKKVNKMEGVESFSVDIKTGKALLESKTGATIDRDALETEVRDAGLTMKALKILEEGSS